MEKYRVFYMSLDAVHFKELIKGRKIIEGRIFDEKRREIDIGDTIVFKKNGTYETCKKKVESVICTLNIRNAMELHGYKKYLPRCDNLDDAVEYYKNIKTAQGSTYGELEDKYGFVSFVLVD